MSLNHQGRTFTRTRQLEAWKRQRQRELERGMVRVRDDPSALAELVVLVHKTVTEAAIEVRKARSLETRR